MIDIEIKPSKKCVFINKNNPLKPSKYFGWCISVYKDIPTIGLTKYTDENNVIEILNHEIMHVVLFKLEGNKAYSKFDRLDNDVNSWYE